MASTRKTAERTANAVQTIETASAALANKFELKLASLPRVGRLDAKHAQAVQLDHLAGVLRSIAIATDAATVEDFDGPQLSSEGAQQFREDVQAAFDNGEISDKESITTGEALPPIEEGPGVEAEVEIIERPTKRGKK